MSLVDATSFVFTWHVNVNKVNYMFWLIECPFIEQCSQVNVWIILALEKKLHNHSVYTSLPVTSCSHYFDFYIHVTVLIEWCRDWSVTTGSLVLILNGYPILTLWFVLQSLLYTYHKLMIGAQSMAVHAYILPTYGKNKN